MAEINTEAKDKVVKESPKKAPPAPKAEVKLTGNAPGVTDYAAKNAKLAIIRHYNNKWS
jgi:hypothetical protein